MASLTRDDGASLPALELYERSFATLSFLPRVHTLEEHRAWFGQVVDQRETWVWEEEGALIGFIVLGDATVDYLYVEPEMTGRGIGSALLDHAKRRRPAGFCLWTFQQNQDARRFYERRGLRLIRLTNGEHNEEKTPDALYAWGLADVSRRQRAPPASSVSRCRVDR